MRSRPAPGEVGLAVLFAALGLAWIHGASGLPFWEGFAPQSGLLPFFYGILLTGLSVAIAGRLFLTENSAADREPIRKPLLILAALAVTVVGVPAVGFGPSIFLLLVFLFATIERLPLVRALIVSGVTTAILLGVFRWWLAVPLPAGPLGF